MIYTPPSEPVIFYIHIPKASGTSIAWMVRKKIGDQYIETYYDGHVSFYEKWKDLPYQAKANLRFIIGHHITYGCHHLYNYQNYQYMTMLRDPIDTVISLYLFIRRTNHHFLWRYAQNSLLEFLQPSKVGAYMDNHYARYLLGYPTGEAQPIPPLNITHLEMAKGILEKNFIFGLTERFRETMSLFKKKVPYIFENITHYPILKKTKKEEYQKLETSGTLEQCKNKIRQYNMWDIELYKFAKQLFEERIKKL